MLNGSNSIDMIGHLHCDIFNQNKFLLYREDSKVKLIIARSAFSIMDETGTGYSYCLFAFDLTPDLSANEGHWNFVKYGTE